MELNFMIKLKRTLTVDRCAYTESTLPMELLYFFKMPVTVTQNVEELSTPIF